MTRLWPLIAVNGLKSIPTIYFEPKALLQKFRRNGLFCSKGFQSLETQRNPNIVIARNEATALIIPQRLTTFGAELLAKISRSSK